MGDLLLEVLDCERGEVNLFVELPVNLQGSLETGGTQRDASTFVTGSNRRRNWWQCTVEQRDIGRVFRTVAGTSALGRRGARCGRRQSEGNREDGEKPVSRGRDHPGSVYART